MITKAVRLLELIVNKCALRFAVKLFAVDFGTGRSIKRLFMICRMEGPMEKKQTLVNAV